MKYLINNIFLVTTAKYYDFKIRNLFANSKLFKITDFVILFLKNVAKPKMLKLTFYKIIPMIISITIKVPVRPIPAEQCTTVGPGFGSNPSVVSKKKKKIYIYY